MVHILRSEVVAPGFLRVRFVGHVGKTYFSELGTYVLCTLNNNDNDLVMMCDLAKRHIITGTYLCKLVMIIKDYGTILVMISMIIRSRWQ